MSVKLKNILTALGALTLLIGGIAIGMMLTAAAYDESDAVVYWHMQIEVAKQYENCARFSSRGSSDAREIGLQLGGRHYQF